MRNDAFSRCHPAVNFIFFLGAIGFGVVIQHPAYLVAAVIGAAVYYLLLAGRRGWKTFAFLLPAFLAISLINPVFNTRGQNVLFYLFGRPYTWQALCYGMAVAAIFVVMMLWFGCYNVVLTSDKFTSLFGNLIPALSLLLVMVLRMIPGFMRKARNIQSARKSIGLGVSEHDTISQKVRQGIGILSALTDWALEGSVVTADSMRARGYGSAKRTNFRIYRMTKGDWLLLAMELLLIIAVVLFGGTGAEFVPIISVDPLTAGFIAYCIYLLIPTALYVKEAVLWRILLSKI